MVKDKESALRYNDIIEDLLKGILNGAEIGHKYGVSRSYISQVKSSLPQLTIEPIFINDRLVCNECKKRDERYLKIKSDNNGETKIICHICYNKRGLSTKKHNNIIKILKRGLVEYNRLMSIVKPSKSQLSKVDMSIIEKATKEALNK